MKRTVGIAALAVAGVILTAGPAVATGGGHDPVVICHKGETIAIDDSAWPGHEKHGDTKGACAPPPCPTPDPVTVTAPAPDPITVTAPAPDPVTVTAPAPDPITVTAPAPDPVTITATPPTETVTAPAPDPVTVTVTATPPTVTATPEPLTCPVPERQRTANELPNTGTEAGVVGLWAVGSVLVGGVMRLLTRKRGDHE